MLFFISKVEHSLVCMCLQFYIYLMQHSLDDSISCESQIQNKGTSKTKTISAVSK